MPTTYKTNFRRGQGLVGRQYGIFEVVSHVGAHDDSEFVNLRCSKCGSTVPVKRDQLQAKAKDKRCRGCQRKVGVE